MGELKFEDQGFRSRQERSRNVLMENWKEVANHLVVKYRGHLAHAHLYAVFMSPTSEYLKAIAIPGTSSKHGFILLAS